MDEYIHNSLKYKLEKKLERYLENELKKYSTMKWLGEQNKNKSIFNHSVQNIELLEKKLKKQHERLKKISKQLKPDQIKTLDELLVEELQTNQEYFFYVKHAKSEATTTETEVSSINLPSTSKAGIEVKQEMDYETETASEPEKEV